MGNVQDTRECAVVYRVIKNRTFDFIERDRQKAESRLKDTTDLETGKLTSREINQRNGFLSGLDLKSLKMSIQEGNRKL